MIEFKIYLRDRNQEYLPASGWNEALRAIFERDPQYYDEVKTRMILFLDGKTCNSFDDNLGPLIQNLCLYGAQNILQGKNYSFRVWSYASDVQLRLEGQSAHIDGASCGSAVYPAQELAQTLIACAGQAINFLKMVQSKLPKSSIRAIENLEKLYLEVKGTA